MADSWKPDQNSPEYLAKQGKQYLQKAVEAFERANVSKIDKTTKELIVRLNNCFGEVEVNKANSKIQTEKQNSKPVLMADVNTNKVFGKNISRESIQKIEFIKVRKSLVPDGAWNVSTDNNREIWAWIEKDNEVILKIGSANGMYANSDCTNLFDGYSNVREIEFHDLFDTSLVTNMQSMFCKCRRLKKIDVSEFNTALVTNMRQMFCGCRNLEEVNVSSFDTSKVTNMSQMFCGCKNLKEVDVSSFDISKVTDAQRMFASCRILEKPNMSEFNFNEGTLVQGIFMDSGATNFLPHELAGSRKKTLQIFNFEELKKRRYDRNYQGNSIEKICGKFLSYEENQNMNTIQKDRMIHTLKIASEDKIYFIHDDSLFQRGKNGFAITDKGIYICETLNAEGFVPWKEFKEYEIINSKTGCVEAGQSGNCRVIAYIAGMERRLQVEMLLIEIHKFLNQ